MDHITRIETNERTPQPRRHFHGMIFVSGQPPTANWLISDPEPKSHQVEGVTIFGLILGMAFVFTRA